MDPVTATGALNCSYDLFIFAGEISGDRLGSELLDELLKERPHLKIAAVAGPHMRKHPIHEILSMEEFQVMGFIDVIQALPKIFKLFRLLKRYLLSHPPQAIVLIDYPGFNLRMAKALKCAGFKAPIIQYVCPSVWAWKKGRIDFMNHYLDLLLCIFPFEKACFSKKSLQVEYVGHPLAKKLLDSFPTISEKNIFTIFPGSRIKEVERNLPLQLETAVSTVGKSYPIAISCASASVEALIQNEIKKYSSYSIHIFPGSDNPAWMRRSKIALATSGTITLELALYQVPTLVTYAMTPWDVFLAKYIFSIKLPHYCIVNYTADTRIFPEFYGPDFKKDLLQKALHYMLDDPDTISLCQSQCAFLKQALSSTNASASQQILSILTKSN